MGSAEPRGNRAAVSVPHRRIGVNIDDIAQRLAEFDEILKHLEDDYEDFDDEIVSIPDMSPSEYRAFLSKRAATPYGRVVSEFHDFLVPGVIDAYVRGNADQRQRILDEISSRCFALIKLLSLLRDYRWRLQKVSPEMRPSMIRTLLLLAVLAEEYLDQPDTAMILTSAWRDAEFDGLDPKQFFNEAAALAGHRKVLHGRSASEFLANFEPYDYGRPQRS